jgi:hypothetical protein
MNGIPHPVSGKAPASFTAIVESPAMKMVTFFVGRTKAEITRKKVSVKTRVLIPRVILIKAN